MGLGETQQDWEDQIFGEVVEDELEGAVEGGFRLHQDQAGHSQQPTYAHEPANLNDLPLRALGLPHDVVQVAQLSD